MLAAANLPAAHFIGVHNHAWSCTRGSSVFCLQHASMASPVPAHASHSGGCRTRHLAARQTPLPVRRLRWAAASRATAPPDSRWPRRPCRAHRLPRSRRGPRCGECVQCPGHHRASAWLGASLSLRRSRNRAGASRRTGLPSPGAPRARHLEPRCVAEADNIEVVTRTPIDLVQGTCALSCTASWARGL